MYFLTKFSIIKTTINRFMIASLQYYDPHLLQMLAMQIPQIGKKTVVGTVSFARTWTQIRTLALTWTPTLARTRTRSRTLTETDMVTDADMAPGTRP